MLRPAALAVALIALPPGAEAVQLHFEAWPTPSSETCAAPCYEMRMFLQLDYFDADSKIQGIQMDIRIGEGALPVQLPVHPERNDNAGPGNVHARSDGASNIGVPWDLVSLVATSPVDDRYALMIHAASADFTVGTLVDLVNDPGTSCADADKCGFVEDALALDRVYLGFMNVTRSATPPDFDHSNPHSGPVFGYEHRPVDLPYFEVEVRNIEGVGDAPEVLAQYGRDTGYILFLPEPGSPALLLAGALVVLVSLRRSTTQNSAG